MTLYDLRPQFERLGLTIERGATRLIIREGGERIASLPHNSAARAWLAGFRAGMLTTIRKDSCK